MAANALLRFTQNAATAGDGIAMVGTTGLPVTVENSNNTNVLSWQIDLLYSDPSSSVIAATPYAFNDSSTTPTVTFTPDVRRSYRWQLKVWSVANRAGAPDSTDIRIFTVRETSGILVPPSQVYPSPLPDTRTGALGNKPNEMNIDGQLDGWAGNADGDGLLNDTLTKLLSTSGSQRWVDSTTTIPFVKQNGSRSTPYESLSQALTDVQTGATDSVWAIHVAPGSYDETLTIPAQRSIAFLGLDYATTSINMTSGDTITWAITGSSYVSFKNIRVFRVNTSEPGNVAPNTGTLYLDDASLEHFQGSTRPVDVVGVGPNTHVTTTLTTGRYAVDGIDHVSAVTCGVFAAYDTLIVGDLTISGDATIVSCQIDPGVDITFSGYSQNLHIDGFSNYWLNASGITPSGEHNLVVADTGNMFIPKPINTSSYTLVLADQGRTLTSDLEGDMTITVPLDSVTSFPIGTVIQLYQTDEGRIVVAGAGGVGIRSSTGSFSTRKQYSKTVLTKMAANSWHVGDDTQQQRQLFQINSTSEVLKPEYDDSTLEIVNSSPISLSLPKFSSVPLPLGYEADIVQGLDGQISVVPEDGAVSIFSEGGLATQSQGSRIKALKIDTNSWFIHGDVAKFPRIVPLTGSSNTLGITNLGRYLTISNATASTLTVPKNSSVPFPIGAIIPFARIGVGAIVVAPVDGTVTILPIRGSLRCLGEAYLRKIATDTWILSGDKSSHDYDLVADFGADPTGTIAADTALSNFLAEVASAGGGGTLNIPRGVFKITTHFTVTTDNISLVASKGASFKKFGTNFNMIDLKGNFGEVHGLELNGNDQAQGSGVLITGSNNEVSRCYIHDVGDVTDHSPYGNGGHGICIDGQVTTCQFNRCNRNTIIDCHDIGISHNKATDSRIMDNRVWNNGLEGFTFDNAAHRCQAIGNRLRGNCAIGGAAAMSLDGSDLGILIGNLITATVGVDAIKTNNNLTGGCNSWVCVGNELIDNTGGYGVHLFTGTGDSGTASAAYWTVTGNVCRGNGSGSIRLESGTTNNQVRANALNGTAVSDSGSGNTVN